MAALSKSQFYTIDSLDGLTALDAQIYQQSFPKHFHETYQITLTKRGTFKNQIDGNIIHAFENQVSITHPGEVHATLCDETSGISFFTVYLSPDLLNTFNKAGSLAYFDSVIDDLKLADLLHHIQLQFYSQSKDIEPTIKQIIKRLFEHQSQASKERPTTLLDLTQFCVYDIKFELDAWAKHYGLDKFKFLRLFKQQTGMTPNQYVIYHRIKQSQQLLAQGADLTDTALTCGFYDLPHFHKHFKSMVGVTPMTYQCAYLD